MIMARGALSTTRTYQGQAQAQSQSLLRVVAEVVDVAVVVDEDGAFRPTRLIRPHAGGVEV